LKVKLAKTAGFCMGVRRAMGIVLTEANRGNGPLYTFGPLIHNNQVLDLLASKGVRSVDELSGLEKGTIIIRAHGIPPQQRREIKKTGLNVIDATCPKVAKVQAIIRYHTRKGSTAIIFGNKGHAEVTGLLGYSETPAHVIESVEDVSALPHLEHVFVVAQTTQNEQNFLEVSEALKARFPDLQVFHTICGATYHRQGEILSFVDQVDATVVVGGFHSGNTQRLVQVSRKAGQPTFHVETEKELDWERLSGMKVIGVTAGASTPNWMIKKVVSKLEGLRGEKEAASSHWLKRAFKFLMANNIIVALGALFFAHAAAILSKRPLDFHFPIIAFLYVYAMHVLNLFLDKGASAYNDPERAAFLNKHKRLLVLTGIGAVAATLIISYGIGLTTFLSLCGLSFLGIAYSLPFIPERVQHKYSYIKIKDIPGSRSLCESLAWGAVIAILPLLEMDHIYWPAAAISIMTVFSMGYVRAILFDVFQVQGDLIVGSETLPITLGEKKTLTFVKLILIVTAFILAAGPLLGLVSSFSYIILLPLLMLSFCLMAYEKRLLYPSATLEALVESNFFLAGLLALIWQAF
jgi:4-hydroxy-3-methylbut-2-enyl diphosphate reductase